MNVQIDVRELVQRDLGDPVYRGRRAWTYRCPFHHETKGASLAVWPDGWKCWGSCRSYGDAIEWLRRYHHLSFQDACRDLHALPDHAPEEKPVRRPDSEPPAPDWQKNARQVVHATQRLLWTPVGERALGYLHSRGLTDDTIRSAGLGYWPGKPGQFRNLQRLWVPCGIVLPWQTDDVIWNVKVRRAIGTPKYLGVKGGGNAGLYGADTLTPTRVALVVEGEFDCLIARQEAGDWLTPVTFGAASVHLSARWQTLLSRCSRVLVACDNDSAGQQATAHLLAGLPNAQAIPLPPDVKDLNALHLMGPGQVKQFLNLYRQCLLSA